MAEEEKSRFRHAGRIKDARGGKVTQLDPVAMYLLRHHDVIEAETLRAIANEEGVRITRKERASLIVGVLGLLMVTGLFTHSLIAGDFGDAPFARSASLLFFCFLPWLAWCRLKWTRFGTIAAVMLEHLRCPHCGYDLRLLPTEPADGATICPECGCAWRVESEVR